MKKRYAAALIAAATLLCGCKQDINYAEMTLPPEYTERVPDPDADKDIMQETVIIPENFAKDTYSPVSYNITAEEFEETVQLETVPNVQSYSDGLTGFNGDGFVCLSDHEYVSVPIEVPTSQYYDITVRLCSNGTKVAVMVGGDKAVKSPDGDYDTLDGIAAGAVYSGTGNEFEPCTLSGVYLSKGENKLTLQVISGTAYIDEMTVKNGSTVQKLVYEVSNSPVDPNASLNTKIVKRYLADIYGNRVLTGQFVSAGTNTEINAVYMSTGRYAALRCADIGIFSTNYEGYDKNSENEISTAISWWKGGGLVSYSWYWQPPLTDKRSCFSELTDFDLKKAVTDSDVADMSAASLEAYLQTGRISKECMALISDIDAIAEKLKLLDEAGVPVLFRPMPEAGNGWYWWGRDSESYLWLYNFLFKRMTAYHQLTNIIWVWNGESYDYYPGDDKVDIVGMDIYTSYDISGNNRLMDAKSYTIKSKAAALTECGRIPNPDTLARDGAYWLWFALWKGDYIINSNGSIQYSHVTATQLDYAYNNELFITLDELPDFSRY